MSKKTSIYIFYPDYKSISNLIFITFRYMIKIIITSMLESNHYVDIE